MSYQDDCMRIEKIRRVAGIKRGYGKDTVILMLDDLDALIRRIEALEKQRERLFTFHVFVRGAGYEDRYDRAAEQAAKSMSEYAITCERLTDIVRSTLEAFDAKTG